MSFVTQLRLKVENFFIYFTSAVLGLELVHDCLRLNSSRVSTVFVQERFDSWKIQLADEPVLDVKMQ
jgi:hypothetical protein